LLPEIEHLPESADATLAAAGRVPTAEVPGDDEDTATPRYSGAGNPANGGEEMTKLIEEIGGSASQVPLTGCAGARS
jgi:hypothetical protein